MVGPMTTQSVSLSRRSILLASVAGAAACATAQPESNRLGPDFVEELLPLPRAFRDGVAPYGPSGGLPDNSFDFHQQSVARSREWVGRARTLRRNAHSDDRETLDVLIWDLERDIALADYYWHPFPLGYANSQLTLLDRAMRMAASGDASDPG